MCNQETEKEVERIKKIISEVIDGEIHLKEIKNKSRLAHMESRIIFRIDNPNYVRKGLNNPLTP